MIFSELYGAYYNTVAAVLKAACAHPLGRGEIARIVQKRAFGESTLSIEPALREGRWALLRPDGSTPIAHVPTMPLTELERRWMKSVTLDPRIRLFYDSVPEFPDVEPLFRPEDIRVYDRYMDGDPYEDADYRRNFRMVLEAVKNRKTLQVETLNRK